MVVLYFGLTLSLHAAEVVVKLDNPPPQGMLVFELFDSANTFGDFRDPAATLRLPADGRESYIISNMPSGEYALLMYFDENGNGVLDKNFIGIPTEPIAFSNRYKPKGPPVYNRARFLLNQGETRIFEVGLFRVLGRKGRVGVGLGVIGRSSPYLNYDGGVYQAIPAFTYNGDRLQLLGPSLRFGVVGTGDLRLAATLRYRIGVYEEDDSPALAGLGDRESTLMGGFALLAELPGGVDLEIRYDHDFLDRVGGGAAQVGVDKSLSLGIVRLAPHISMNWLSSELSSYDFGVPTHAATENRQAYRLSNTINIEVGLGSFIELYRDWRILINVSVEFFDDEISASPVVNEDHVIKGFGALNYVF